MNDELSKRMDELFDELVPSCGKAQTEAGEIVRAFSRIAYRYFNDGDRLGVGYGNETCNAAGRYLLEHAHGNKDVIDSIGQMWGTYSDKRYETALDQLGLAVLQILGDNPALRETDTEDMWDHFVKDEDVDDYEEDEWYDDEDEWDDGEEEW